MQSYVRSDLQCSSMRLAHFELLLLVDRKILRMVAKRPTRKKKAWPWVKNEIKMPRSAVLKNRLSLAILPNVSETNLFFGLIYRFCHSAHSWSCDFTYSVFQIFTKRNFQSLQFTEVVIHLLLKCYINLRRHSYLLFNYTFNFVKFYFKTNVNPATIRDDHQNLKLLSIDLNQMHLIGLVERTILVFKSSKSDVSLQSYGL